MNLEALEKNWKARGFSYGVGTIKAGDAVSEAVHESQDELVVMESGEFEYILGNERFRNTGLEDVLIPAGTPHTIRNIGAQDVRIHFGYRDI